MSHRISLISLGFLALCATPSYASPQVPLTETWGDLLQRAPLRAGTRWVRLGLEATHARPGSPILVYALFEGGAESRSRSARSSPQLGPLKVVPIRELRTLRKEVEQAERLQRVPADALHVLHAAALRAPQRGTARYEVRSGEHVLARFSLAAEGAREAPWFVVRGPEEVKAKSSSADTDAEGLRVSSARATARWPGDEALRWETPRQLLPLGTRLPQATPRRTLLGVHVDPSGALTLKLEAGLGELDAHLLARVWIRGRPVGLRQKERQFEERERLLRKRERRVRVRLELATLATAFGAREGDQIELQLLYSPRGVDREGDAREGLEELAAGVPALSKRFVFRQGRADLSGPEGCGPEGGRVLQSLPSWKRTPEHPCVRLRPE